MTVSNFVFFVGWWLWKLFDLLYSHSRRLIHHLHHHLRRHRPSSTAVSDSIPMSTTPKRCLYEVLGLPQSCTQDEVRSAYKKLALQRHPDKLVQSGVSTSEATSSFQELVHAYEVLSDPKERQWYDSHRSQILFSDPNVAANSWSPIPDLFSFFSASCYTGYTNPKTGFYRVYGDLFNRVYGYEVNYVRKLGLDLGLVKEAPAMGDLNSAYAQVNAFYGYWLGFNTVMDFCLVDQYDAAAGVNRKSRRVMEEENKKLRRKAKREYNETVRGLAEFVKKRDKRVIDMMVKKDREREKKLEEEKERKKAMERDKLERARLYKEPEWARVREEEVERFEDEGEEGGAGEGRQELYCVACGKKFKSEKQWKNHEQSKKHKEKVAELRESFIDEDSFEDVEELRNVNDENGDDGLVKHEKGSNDYDAAESVNELGKKFEDSFVLEDEQDDGLDDETSILEAMLSGSKYRRHLASQRLQEDSLMNGDVESDSQVAEFMEYNNRKSARKSRRAKKEKGNNFDGEVQRASDTEVNVPSKECDGLDDSNASVSGVKDEVEVDAERGKKAGKQAVENKDAAKGDADGKPNNLSKRKKMKGKQRNSESTCEKCGKEFDSRNRLHKHLTETGHAALKSR